MKKEYNRYAALALEKAGADARACHQKYIGTEHIVWAYCRRRRPWQGKFLPKME